MRARTDGAFNRALMAGQVPEWIIYFLSPVSGQAQGKAQTAADTSDFFLLPSVPHHLQLLWDSYNSLKSGQRSSVDFFLLVKLVYLRVPSTSVCPSSNIPAPLVHTRYCDCYVGFRQKPGMATAFKRSAYGEGE